MVKLYVPLRRDEVARIVEMAQAERRRPADQAAYLISKQLEQESVKQAAQVAAS